MKTNIVIDTSPTIPYLAKFWVSSYEPKCCQPIKLHDYLKCNISRKKGMMNFIFGMQRNLNVFYKLILSFWMCVTRHAQSTQNKFVYLAISPERHGDEVDFLPADKHETSLQIDSMILMGMVKHSQSSQNNMFAMLLQYLKEEVRDELDFLHADKHQSFLQVDFSTLVITTDSHDQAFSKYSK